MRTRPLSATQAGEPLMAALIAGDNDRRQMKCQLLILQQRDDNGREDKAFQGHRLATAQVGAISTARQSRRQRTKAEKWGQKYKGGDRGKRDRNQISLLFPGVRSVFFCLHLSARFLLDWRRSERGRKLRAMIGVSAFGLDFAWPTLFHQPRS